MAFGYKCFSALIGLLEWVAVANRFMCKREGGIEGEEEYSIYALEWRVTVYEEGVVA